VRQVFRVGRSQQVAGCYVTDGHVVRGGARVYRNGQLVATDRISAYDFILDSEIPDKGKVLTQLSLWWFEQLVDIIPNHVISTEVRWEGERLDGSLTSPNRRGMEKARCLRKLLDERKDKDNYAYGNSASDLPHMRLVRHGQLVNGSLAARRSAAKFGIACVDWN